MLPDFSQPGKIVIFGVKIFLKRWTDSPPPPQRKVKIKFPCTVNGIIKRINMKSKMYVPLNIKEKSYNCVIYVHQMFNT